MSHDNILMKSSRIISIETNFDKIEYGDNQINLKTKIRALIPDDDKNKEIIVRVIIDFTIKDTDITILHITNDGHFDLGKDMNEDQIQNVIKKYAARTVYEDTRNKIGKILNISNVDFMNIPEFDHLNRSE